MCACVSKSMEMTPVHTLFPAAHNFFRPQVREESFSVLPDSFFSVFRSEKYLTRPEK